MRKQQPSFWAAVARHLVLSLERLGFGPSIKKFDLPGTQPELPHTDTLL